MPSRLDLKVDGQAWTGWKSVSVTISLEAAASAFSIVAKSRSAWPVRAGSAVQVLCDGELVLTGFVDRISPGLDDGGVVATVEGRSRTADLVDCSAYTDPGEWWNARLQDIAAEVARPFGIGVVDAVGALERFPVFRIQTGETAFEAIERACRMRAVLTYPTVAGDLLLTRPNTIWEGVELREGFNVQAASASQDMTERFEEYVVQGQAGGTDETHGAAAAHIAATARDSGARRGRRLVIVAETAVSIAAAQARAQWEATTRAARASKLSVTTVGWRHHKGGLWLPNTRVDCSLESVKVAGPRLVTSVKLTQSEEGSKTELELARPDGFAPQPDLPREENPFEDLVDQDLDAGDEADSLGTLV